MAAKQFLVPGNHATVRGLAAPGATASLYTTGTTTPKPFYSTSALLVPLGSTITANGVGNFPIAYQDETIPFRLILRDKNGAEIDGGDIDPFYFGQTLITVTASGITPEMFDAAGDGIADDSAAFAALSAHINGLDGGVIDLTPGATYIVGGQALSPGHQDVAGGYAFPPNVEAPLDFNGCTSAVIIRGNGATIKCRDGAMYGTFNDDGTNKGTTAPYFGGGLGTPYQAMIRADACSGGIRIENVELDGNIANAVIGGEYDVNGRQIPYTGLYLGTNTCHVTIENVYSHHHGCDGITDWAVGVDENDPRYPVTMTDCDFISNGRQGMSWCGGKARTAINCKFNDTGKDIAPLPYSTPSAGVDIEAQSSICREGHFINCEFSNNSGPGVASVGDTQDMQFDHCKFVGTTNATYYGNGNDKSYRFNDCLFVGALINLYPNADRYRATQFRNCRFLFGTARSPTGAVYTNGTFMMDLGGLGQQNISFDHCQWDSEGNTAVTLPYFNDGLALINNCEMTQDNAVDQSILVATYSGNNKITTASANPSFSSYLNYGKVTLNGVERSARFSGGFLAGISGALLNPSVISGPLYLGLAGGGVLASVDGADFRIGNTSAYAMRLLMNGGSTDGFIQVSNFSGGYGNCFMQANSFILQPGGATTATVNTTGINLATGKHLQVNSTTIIDGSTNRLTATGMPALTGDVTTAGGALAATIAANAVTFAKFQQLPTVSLVGNSTGGTANAQSITLATDHSFSGTTIQLGAFTGDITKAAGSLATTIGNNAVTYAKMQDVTATSRFIGRITAGAGDPEELTGTQAATLIDAATTSLKGVMSAQDKTRLDADWTWYRTLIDCSGYLTAADAAGTYGMAQSDKLAISGTGTLYPLDAIYIASADYPAIGTLNPKLRIRAMLYCNDVAPGVTFTIGLHPITRPATSGGAGLCIYTIGAAVASSTVAIATPAADSSNVAVTAADFSLPSDGHYVIGVVTSGGSLAASSHVHISALLQLRFA